MLLKQKLGLGGALLLPSLAGALVFAVPATADAQTTCLYAGQPYSVGACIASVCTPPKAQMCLAGGTWTTCSNCGEDPPLD